MSAEQLIARRTRHTLGGVLVAAIAVLALTGCGGGSGSAEPEDSSSEQASVGAEITIADFSFGDPVTVTPGSTVTVANADGVDHTWTSEDGLFDSGTLTPGSSFEFTFDEAGEFSFLCEIHPSMTGSVTVNG